MDKSDLDINGMTNIPDVINMIIDTIDDGSTSDLDSAKDYVGQLGDYLAKKDKEVTSGWNGNYYDKEKDFRVSL